MQQFKRAVVPTTLKVSSIEALCVFFSVNFGSEKKEGPCSLRLQLKSEQQEEDSPI